MEDVGPSYVRTWDINPSQTLATYRQTYTLLRTHTTKESRTLYTKGYKKTNQRIRTTHNLYPTTSYTNNINPQITNRTSSGRSSTPLAHKGNSLKTSHIVDKDRSKSSNANAQPMTSSKQLSTTSMISMNRAD